jgi:DNA-binding SARP family transcriptional activator/TolB-like protein
MRVLDAAPEVSVVEFRMLGALSLLGTDGHDQRAVLAQPKRVALLAYLAVSPRFHRRDSLVALFWPDLDQVHARAALRQTLHGLRRALGEDEFADRGDEEVGLDAARLHSDVVEFQRAVDADRLAEALDIYRGDLLEGFFIRGAPEFERWLEDERARLKNLALSAASTLAEHSEARGNLEESAQWARRAVRIAPLDEKAQRRLMRTLDRLGNRAGALEIYEDFAKRLINELEADPAPETRAMADAIRERATARPLSAEHPAHPTPAVSGRSRRPRFSLAVALLGVAGVVVGVSLPSAPALNTKRVLVVPFTNRTGDSTLDPLGNLAADWITRGLASTEVLELADPGVMVLGANRTGATSQVPDAGALARASGSGMLVSGSLYLREGQIELNARITDVQSGSVVHPLDPVFGDPHEPRAALKVLRERITAVLAETVDPRLSALVSIAGQPPRYDAYLAFSAGVEIFYGGRRARDALPYFQRAAALDSTYAQPLIWAAWAHGGTALDQCDSTAVLATRLAGMSLTPLEQLQIDRVMARCRGDLAAAYTLGRRLTDALPRSELMWEQLARDALDFNHPQEAVTILEGLHPDSGVLSGRAGYYNWLTNAYHVLGEHKRELRAARRARERFPRNLATLRMELLALSALGRGREVIERLDEIETLPPDPIRLPAPVMRETALDLAAHGDSAAAGIVLARTLAWLASQTAADRATEDHRFERALTHSAAGHADSARAIAAELARRHPRDARYAGLLGTLAAQRGDRAEAVRLSSVLVGLERPFGRGEASYWRACIAARLGERDAAVDLLGRALDAGYVYQVRFLDAHMEPSFVTLRGYSRFETLLRAKG